MCCADSSCAKHISICSPGNKVRGDGLEACLVPDAGCNFDTERGIKLDENPRRFPPQNIALDTEVTCELCGRLSHVTAHENAAKLHITYLASVHLLLLCILAASWYEDLSTSAARCCMKLGAQVGDISGSIYPWAPISAVASELKVRVCRIWANPSKYSHSGCLAAEKRAHHQLTHM